MIDYFTRPVGYARHLATYIKCPSTIRARTLDEYGHGPSLEKCRKYRAEAEQRQRREEIHMEHRARDVKRLFSCGHPRDFENTIERDGRDKCRICRSEIERNAARRQRIKDEKAIDRLNLAPYDPPTRSGKLMARELIEFAAEVFNTTAADLKGSSRFREHVIARSVLVSVLRNERGISYPQIGKLLGGRDHSTVINAIRKLPKYRMESGLVDEALLAITEAARRTT